MHTEVVSSCFAVINNTMIPNFEPKFLISYTVGPFRFLGVELVKGCKILNVGPLHSPFLAYSASCRASWADQMTADDIQEKWKQQKELNWYLCRRAWRHGRKRKIPEGRRAEKNLAREEGGLKNAVGRCRKQKGAIWAAALWRDPCTREKEGCGCLGSLAVTHAYSFPFATSLGELSQELTMLSQTWQARFVFPLDGAPCQDGWTFRSSFI